MSSDYCISDTGRHLHTEQLAPRWPFFRGDPTGRRNTMERVFSVILIVAVAAYPLDKTADAID